MYIFVMYIYMYMLLFYVFFFLGGSIKLSDTHIPPSLLIYMYMYVNVCVDIYPSTGLVGCDVTGSILKSKIDSQNMLLS